MSDQKFYQATIDGTISWDLIFDYDNTENSGTITDKITVTTVESIEYATFEKTVNETVRTELEKNHVGSEVGASYEGVTAKLEASMEISSEITNTLQEATSKDFKSNYSKTTTHERDVVVGPHSKLSLYQQRFSMAGASVQGNAVSTNPPPTQTVTIQYLVSPIRFIKSLNVVYGSHPSDAPGDRVLEYSGQNDDINSGYGGKYVWIVPTYTYTASEAATRFDLFIQGKAHNGWSDLAKGAGGDFRYLDSVADTNNPVKLTDLRLYRSSNAVGSFPVPYTSHTTDINAKRGKTFLYLICASRTAY